MPPERDIESCLSVVRLNDKLDPLQEWQKWQKKRK